MPWLRFFRRRYWDEERSRELEAYLEIETDENITRGMPPDQARSAARRKLGNPTLVREEIYRMNSISLLETLWQDVRYAARLLRLNLGFTTVAVASLALGIGANTAIFQLLDAVRLRTLPVRNPRELAEVRIQNLDWPCWDPKAGTLSSPRRSGTRSASGSRRFRTSRPGAPIPSTSRPRANSVSRKAGLWVKRRVLQRAGRATGSGPRLYG